MDHAIACAGIIEKGKWFDADLTVESVERGETTQVLEINFLGVMFFARVGVVFLRHGKERGTYALSYRNFLSEHGNGFESCQSE